MSADDSFPMDQISSLFPQLENIQLVGAKGPQSFVLEGMDLTEAQFAQLMKNIETVAVETAEAYSHIMETEYPK